MEKMELGKPVEIEDGLFQTSFNIRDIHFQSGGLIVHTLQGNIVPLPLADFASFISAINTAVKDALINPRAPAISEVVP